MGRPPLPIGTYGKIRVYKLGEKRYRARTLYRDYDGVTRPVERVGKSRTAAEDKLRTALRDRGRAALDGEITPDTKVAAVAELWLREVDESDRAARTKLAYRDVWNRVGAPATGQLRIRDMRVSQVDRMLREVRERIGHGTAHHLKGILSGILGLAVRHDALDANPLREVSRARSSSKPEKVAITVESLAGLRTFLRRSDSAQNYDLVDLVDVLSGLGCRIGELLALDWTKVDDQAGTLAIEGTVIRIPGQGLIAQPHTKSKAGMRTIQPPAWVMVILLRRYESAHGAWVFPSTRGALRDPDNTRKQLRDVVRGTPWEGLHPHALRRLVATQMDAAGASAREIADYLGHERVSMTQDVYMSRRVTGGAAAAALEQLAPETDP